MNEGQHAESAASILDLMITKGIQPDLIVYTAVITAFVKVGNQGELFVSHNDKKRKKRGRTRTRTGTKKNKTKKTKRQYLYRESDELFPQAY